jgi:hypothetical protein
VAHGGDHNRGGHRETRPHVDLETYGAGADAAPVEANGSNGTGHAALPAEAVPLAIVAVAAGDGLARIFDSYGVAAVVHGGQTNNPSTGELLDAVEKMAADEILLLPNNPNVVLAARQAAEMTTAGASASFPPETPPRASRLCWRWIPTATPRPTPR